MNDFTHSEWFQFFFLPLCLFVSACCKILTAIFLIRSGGTSKSGVKMTTYKHSPDFPFLNDEYRLPLPGGLELYPNTHSTSGLAGRLL